MVYVQQILEKKYAYQYFYWKTIQGKGMNYLLWSCSIVCISNLSNWLTSQDLQKKKYNQQYSKPFSSWLCRKLSLILLKVVKTCVDTYDIINHWGKVRYETFVWNQLWTAINKISKITNVMSVIKKKKKFLRIEAQKRARSI